MTFVNQSAPDASMDRPAPGHLSLYRAIWRWHFFAGLLVVPFMIGLALTGALYLFDEEIDATVFAYRNIVEPAAMALPPSVIVENAAAALPAGAVRAYRTPAGPKRSARVTLATEAGSILVFVDPYTGAVLDTVPAAEEFNQVVEDLHSLDYFGKSVEKIIEIVAGFAILLVFTGIYLWWPRRQSGGVVTIRGSASRRVFWRDLHAVTGIFSAGLIVFLAFTGLFWSGYWGSNVNATLTAAGYGYPAELWDNVPESTKVSADVLSRSGWLLQDAPVPASLVGETPSIGLDRAVAIADAAGMLPGYEMALPSGETGVYTAAIFPDDLTYERTIHIDRYSGARLVDIGWNQYPALGQAIEWGINVHTGQEWGLFNQILMLVTCLAIILACVSAVVMWWKRRPSGRLGVPPMPEKKSVYFGLWVLAIVFGLAFPLTGLAIAVMIAVDQALIRLGSRRSAGGLS